MVPPEFDGFRIDCSAEPLKTRPIGRNYNDWSRSGTRQNFSENGSETMENDQTGLPSSAAAITARLQASFAEQLAARDAAHRADLQEMVEECRTSAHGARLAKVQLQKV